ncbi:hypothetical protein [Ruegeria arenilitoris]|uniref:hypothetical protein n=1 Tax=Ruegeria arenilitoris TaxID=1173585 RepID=UPI00147DC5F4|nr:hypothetical protein [Ruegeria arenilitoris]
MDVLALAKEKYILDCNNNTAEGLAAHFAFGSLTFDDALTATRDALTECGIAQRALDAVASLFTSGDVIELCAIGTDGSVVAFCEKLDGAAGQAALHDFIKAQFGLRNLYLGVCSRKEHMAGQHRRAKAQDVACRRHLVADLDMKDAPDVDPDWTLTIAALDALTPSLVVHSGNGFQVWFRVQEQRDGALQSSSAGPLAEALAALGSDPVADPARIVRLPYTLNIPTERKRQRGAKLCLALPVAQFDNKQELAA